MQSLLVLSALVAIATASVCPGGSKCPADDTCCPTPLGNEGCCPWANANCCGDMIHCCPAGYQCSTETGFCIKGDGRIVEWMVKLAPPEKPRDIPQNLTTSGRYLCPDHQQSCPNGYTCCASDSGYGCCPFGNAVCCVDKIHCCPEGQTCDLIGKSCTQKITTMSVPKEENVNDFCPDRTFCTGMSTCCPVRGGHWGCCPLLGASCCPDMQHCCPWGTSCTAHGTCIASDNQDATKR